MFAIKEPCRRCGAGTSENLDWLANFWHDLRCWGLRVAIYNLRWLLAHW